ncbi:MAG: type II toxin-antitoxin system RelE/ParE family toxin [Candidatus Omnitrophica bacterium]|nr:type II toxin-antitoxin system RelE/ParE family toxin [Candidatus Omnitrophota bacterium]
MAKYKVEIKRSAVKEIESLPRKEILIILDRIRLLADDPRPRDVRKLSGDEKYRIRCGDYRILYLIEDDVLIIYVVKVGHRKDVYR